MMTELESYLHRGRRLALRLGADPRLSAAAQVAGRSIAGLVASAAGLLHAPLPLTMGLILARPGWQGAVTALGAAAGYGIFWGSAGYPGMVWALIACVLTVLPLGQRMAKMPLLPGAVCGLAVAVTGLGFQLLGQAVPSVGVYFLQIALGVVCPVVLGGMGESPGLRCIAQGAGVLALAQVMPVPWLGMGYTAAGWMAAGGSFPAAVAAGLALDLARITPVTMTAVTAGIWLTGKLRPERKWITVSLTGPVYLLAMALGNTLDVTPLPMLVLGGALAAALPPRPETARQRGPVGAAQVRLELMAGALGQWQQLLMEVPQPEIDCAALLERTRERACGGCPNRKTCRDIHLPEHLLTDPPADTGSLPVACRKPGRMLLELQRSREQLRLLRSAGARQGEYRQAVIQQVQFLGDYLRLTADALPQRPDRERCCYSVEAAAVSAGREKANGDLCQRFQGPGGQYYIVLCDGMGTGLGAAQDSREMGNLLRQMLSAGFPAEYALRSCNSLAALGSTAAAATVDLVRIDLNTGWAEVYKWGAAPSWLLRKDTAEKIGTAAPPPGLSVTEGRETVERLSLRRGETLVICSDGVDAEEILRTRAVSAQEPAGEIAAYLVERGREQAGDDATCAVVRLHPAALST